MIDLIEYFQTWYKENCDGVWEHFNGIDISNIDNPGWKVAINGVVEKKEITLNVVVDKENWLNITANNSTFLGYCGTKNLKELLEYAVHWIENKD